MILNKWCCFLFLLLAPVVHSAEDGEELLYDFSFFKSDVTTNGVLRGIDEEFLGAGRFSVDMSTYALTDLTVQECTYFDVKKAPHALSEIEGMPKGSPFSRLLPYHSLNSLDFSEHAKDGIEYFDLTDALNADPEGLKRSKYTSGQPGAMISNLNIELKLRCLAELSRLLFSPKVSERETLNFDTFALFGVEVVVKQNDSSSWKRGPRTFSLESLKQGAEYSRYERVLNDTLRTRASRLSVKQVEVTLDRSRKTDSSMLIIHTYPLYCAGVFSRHNQYSTQVIVKAK